MKIAAEYKIDDFTEMKLHAEIAMRTHTYFINSISVGFDLCGDRSAISVANPISKCSHPPGNPNRISMKIDENRENRENREFVPESYLDFRNAVKPCNSDNTHPWATG